MTAEAPGRRTPHSPALFMTGLGIGQIVSWGTLIYAFPLLVDPMAAEIGWSRTEAYLLASLALGTGALTAYPLGAAIDRGHGRAVMAAGSLLSALLLWAWGSVTAGWQLVPVFAGIGVAQSMTLYEPAFAVVARRYGDEARRGITTLTLWGGFASTVFVPATQLLEDALGWRGALLALAATHLLLCLPLHLAVIERAPPRPAAPLPDRTAPGGGAREGGVVAWALRQPAFWALGLSFTVYYATFTAISFHLFPLLTERGLSAAEAVAGIALIGPAQVAGRLLVAAFSRQAPIRHVGVATTLALPAAMGLLLLPWTGFGPLAVFALIYGAANGIMTIVRGAAVPEMLTREAYGAINGLLTVPTAILRALAPTLAAMLWQASGGYAAVELAALAACGVVLAGFLLAVRFRVP